MIKRQRRSDFLSNLNTMSRFNYPICGSQADKVSAGGYIAYIWGNFTPFENGDTQKFLTTTKFKT